MSSSANVWIHAAASSEGDGRPDGAAHRGDGWRSWSGGGSEDGQAGATMASDGASSEDDAAVKVGVEKCLSWR